MHLTEELRLATRNIHSVSDKLVNVKLLIALTDKELYGRALLLFYYIFVQIESSMKQCRDHAALKGLHEVLPKCIRANAMAADLDYYLGANWSTKYAPTPAVVTYIERIQTVAKEEPTLLLPYCYHMYMALLFGGQMIKTMVKKSFVLPVDRGLETFNFNTTNCNALRKTFKEKINAVKVDDAMKKRILDESIRVFQMNNQVVRSLENTSQKFFNWLMRYIIVIAMVYWEGDQPPFRNDYNNPNGPPPMEFHERGPPGGRDSYSDRYEPDFRGRRDSRDYGYDRHPPSYHGNGRWNRSRSRSPRNRPRGNEDSNNVNVVRKALHGMEPMDSYKVFMMRQDEHSTPETYQQRYEEYKKKYLQRLSRAFFEDHKREEWLQERYSPAIRFRLEQIKKIKKISESKQFMERLTSGMMNIDMDEENQLNGRDYDNDLEDSKRILYVRRIPCACPIATLSEAIKKSGGVFQQIYLSDPVKKSNFEFDRTAYIVFETAEMATEALPKIHNTFVQDGEIFTPFRLQVSQHRSRAPIKTPSYLSVPERLTHDYEQALKLAITLDEALYSKSSDRSSYGIDALLAHEDVVTKYTSDKQKLDLIMAYLRRVHHFIYYAGVQCLDMGDIMHAHPALFCRPPATPKDLEQGEKDSTEDTEAKGTGIGGWAASLDDKVRSFLQEWDQEKQLAAQEKEKTLVEEIEAREELSLESTYSNYAEKAGDDGKHRCRLCTKLFKAVDFVKKHIRNKHPELVMDKVAEVGESYMWEQYREDPNRPLPPIETTNTLSAPALGGRPGGRGSYNDRGRNGGYGSPNGYRDRGYNNRSRGPFNDRPARSPPRRPPQGDMPVDPRSVSKSYQDLDNLKDNKVELSFDDAFDNLPPPKKKTKA